MAPKTEKLAKIYLESSPAEISEETTDELIDFIMSQFKALPFAVQASEYMCYDTVEELYADIEKGHLWVSMETYGADFYPNPFYGFAFLAIHDYDHYQTHSDFSLEGEITAYRAIAKRSPSLEIQKILYSEIVLKSAAHIYLGHAPEPKLVFA
ncbi:transposase [Chroogloeocystis siderophila]|jgi:hypothetical protein|uniref:Transposase n=1 Tax=Chroogloeocystis siderophila 5.2 s.c.1 TaxID=247279 RepID=A0A1U7HV44_9CHRO|nr:transposase [Chroogloeocystis siderophila]OKH27441.1 transposase [Chroogloeocystis siderophila 5.2 s.c.1]